MIKINLLPWREQKRDQEKKLFLITILVAVFVTVVIVIMVNYSVTVMLSRHEKRNLLLKKEIAVLDTQIKEIRSLKKREEIILARMAMIQNLQSTRTLMVHLFDEMINILPHEVYITKLERKNDNVTLSGYAESNTNISFLMSNVEHNGWLHAPVLIEIKKIEDKKEVANNQFKLGFLLLSKNQLGINFE